MPNQRLDGQWWWQSGHRRPGVLTLNESGRPLLHIDGSFPGFESYEPGGRGSPSRRNLIRGTTADGRQFTLVNCIEVSSAERIVRGRKKHARTTYAAPWYLTDAHYAQYADLKFQGITFSCDYLNDLIRPTFVFPNHFKGFRGFRLTYRRPHSLTIALKHFTINVSQDIPTSFSNSFYVSERGSISIAASGLRPFDELWGAVTSIRSMLEFMADRRLELNHVSAHRGHRRHCEIGGLSTSRIPTPLHDHPDREFLFTLRTLHPATRRRIVNGWAALIADERLQPIWALYSAATQDNALFTETRFLMLAQALETLHRSTSTMTRVTAEEHTERMTRVLARIEDIDRDWVRSGLAWSNELTLRSRLEDLLDHIPQRLFDNLFGSRADRKTLINRIVQTRNYLTHFSPQLQTQRYRGFELMEATAGLRELLQYFLLQQIGFNASDATDIACVTSNRDYARPRITRGMFPDA